MQLDDRLRIETPEGVSLDVTLAGLGSRMGAALLDLMIQGAALLAVTLALSLAGTAISPDLGAFLLGIGTLAVVVIVVGYYLLFEALNGGRTPGKAAFGLRVASVDGSALTLGAVALRTLMRLIDFLPAAYAIGAVSIVVSHRNQRLGDIVANTVVIRDRTPAAPPAGAVAPDQPRGWDVSTVPESEMALVRRFVARRGGLEPSARTRLAAELATRLRTRVAGGEDMADEAFLDQLLVEKAVRSR